MFDLGKTEDFNKFVNDIDLRKYPTNFFVGKTNAELLTFIQKQQEVLEDVKAVMAIIQDYATMAEVRQAKIVLEHWKQFNEFLEKNPDYKEEWDALCMAMRLQES